MTKSKSRQPRGKMPRRQSSADVAGDEGGDVCELVLAELQSRRVRLRKLLHLLEAEAQRVQATSAPARAPNAEASASRLSGTFDPQSASAGIL